MSDGKMFSGAKKLGGHVPKWAWYVSGGVGVAAGIYYFRSRKSVTAPSSPDPYASDGTVGYTDGQAPGSFIVPSDNGAQAVPAQINTDIPQAGYDFFGRVLDTFGGIIQTQHDDQAAILGMLANGGSSQGGSSAGGVVTANPPSAPAAKKAKPNPVAKLDPGYRAGSTVDMGANARRNFPGAIGWVRMGSGETGMKHWVDVHVRYCNKLERWRVRPNAHGSPWAKTWSGARPEICK